MTAGLERFELGFTRRIARRFASLNNRCFGWSIAIHCRVWDGTDPAMRGDNRAGLTPVDAHVVCGRSTS